MNIYQKLQKISEEVGYVAKNLNVSTGKNNSYKAVSEADVLNAVKPLEAKYGVYSYPVKRQVIDSGEMVSTSTYNGNTTERRQLYLRVETVYRFVNVEAPEEYIEITTYGDGVDSQDKAPGKAMTYADKYALLKAYKIQTGDDPDKDASQPLERVSRQKKGCINPGKVQTLRNLCQKYGRDESEIYSRYGRACLEDMTDEDYRDFSENGGALVERWKRG